MEFINQDKIVFFPFQNEGKMDRKKSGEFNDVKKKPSGYKLKITSHKNTCVYKNIFFGI